MSWNFGVTNTQIDELDAALNAVAEVEINNIMSGRAGAEAMLQMEAATYAAVEIAKSGGVGRGPVTVRLSGHANPGHAKPEGWAQDFIQVVVEQAVIPRGQD